MGQDAEYGIYVLQKSLEEANARIELLKQERDNAIKAMDHHINCDMRTQEENQILRDALGKASEVLGELVNIATGHAMQTYSSVSNEKAREGENTIRMITQALAPRTMENDL